MADMDTAIKTKMLESGLLRNQAAANTKEQFTNSPNLHDALMNAIMDAMAAHQVMSKQALNSESIRARMLATLLGPGELWDGLRGANAGLGVALRPRLDEQSGRSKPADAAEFRTARFAQKVRISGKWGSNRSKCRPR